MDLTPLNPISSFSQMSAMLIDGSETVGGDLNFRFRMLLKGGINRHIVKHGVDWIGLDL